MGAALAAFARHADPGRRKVLVVLLDNAGWHVARRLAVPANVVLHFLPPCTPELQPADPLWPLVREAVANRSVGRIDRLRAILRGRLAYLARNPAIVQPVVGCRWAARLEWEGINLIRYQSPGRNSRRCRRVWCWGAAAPSGVTPLL